ncbi:MAG: ATPase, T2SS/T4P/T4SS family [Candidatus Peribacteraceae bacterium]|nr:ATPase, T2SS/T4P/T4SS family [Candidatus Peribacteraceae bacterium]MDD5074874.1 ATPase, T2SS/T4P/T4SS family [Candidatus Peribacteraceae bacterium]
MPISDVDLGQVLVKQSYLSEQELVQMTKLAEGRGVPLLTILFEQGLLTQELFESAMAEFYKLQFFDIQSHFPSPETVAELPEEIAQKFHAVVVEHTGETVTVATSDPGQELLEEAIRLNLGQKTAVLPENEKKTEEKPKKGFSFGKEAKEPEKPHFNGTVTFVYSPQAGIEAACIHYRKPLSTRFQAIIANEKKVAPEILEEILIDAIELRASDVHFEPQEKIVIVRFRVDGVMHEAGRIPKENYEGVVNRIKIESNMRIDEHFAAQDGAIRFNSPRGDMDIRVSVVPVVEGEKVVMRLLASYVRALTLADLGFSPEHQKILTEAAHKPFGMVLTTGPTGSGKSTTLSALMKMRNTPDVNISTIEDPVEYKMAGVNHIQVNPKTNLTFASGLRALVRQDPDIILVGEIRDGETADISVNAALTGHLVLSTLHSNDAATAIPRLLEMGVEPFLLASTLEVIVAQRLVRRICPHCRHSVTITEEEAGKLFPGAGRFFTEKKPATLYRGKGCDACAGTGYHGRVGIYELLAMTPKIEELVTGHASSTIINEAAHQEGMKLMFEDGFDKVLAGVTTIEELLRVAAPPALVLRSAHGTDKH